MLLHTERLRWVHPRLVDLARLLASQSAIDLCVVTGGRNAEDARRKWSEGRTTPGPHAGEAGYPELGQTVTNCQTIGQTAHAIRTTPAGDYGCAVDLQYVGRDGKLLDTNTAANRALYESAGLLAEGEGFRWGGRFPKYDAAHYEIPNWRAYPLAEDVNVA